MAGTFAEFKAWPDRTEIAVAEVSALLTDAGGLSLTGWTGTAGQPNTYQIAITNRTAAVGSLGTLYRRVTGVRINGAELTAQTSIANVNANAGSWYWDEAAGVLYARTAGAAVDPDTLASVAARVTFYLATAPLVLETTDGVASSAIYFAPMFAPTDAPADVAEIDDVLSGRKTTIGGSLALVNEDGAWFPLVALESGYTFRNQRVIYRVGGTYRGQSLGYSEFQTIGTMRVADVAVDEVVCTFALNPIVQLADVTVPVTPCFEAEYPALGDGVRGLFKPLIYGRAWVAPLLTSTAGLGTWTVADAAYQNLFAVHAVEAVDKSTGAIAGLSPGLDYTANLTTCTIALVSDRFSYLTHTIRCDVTGKTTITGGATGARGYLSTFGEIAEDLIRTFVGAASSDIDAAGFAEANADARQELAVVLTSPRSLASVIATAEDAQPSLERSVNGTIQQTRAGQWTARVWDPIADTATIAALRREDLAGFAPQPRLEKITTAVRVFYQYDGRSDTYAAVERIDQPRRSLTGTTDRRDVYTFLRAPGDAEVMAKRYEAIEAFCGLEIDFAERGTLLALSTVGERVAVTYAPAPHTSGAYTGRVFALVRLTRGYAPRMTIAGQLRDVDRITNRAGRWKSTGSPNYASSTPTQRAASGYWFASTGAPSGFTGSRYW